MLPVKPAAVFQCSHKTIVFRRTSHAQQGYFAALNSLRLRPKSYQGKKYLTTNGGWLILTAMKFRLDYLSVR
jgi:hypothetical protein